MINYGSTTEHDQRDIFEFSNCVNTMHYVFCVFNNWAVIYGSSTRDLLPEDENPMLIFNTVLTTSNLLSLNENGWLNPLIYYFMLEKEQENFKNTTIAI